MAIPDSDVELVVSTDEFDHIIWGLHEWASDLQRGLRKRDDGLHASRAERLEQLKALAAKLQNQRRGVCDCPRNLRLTDGTCTLHEMAGLVDDEYGGDDD